MTEPRSFPERVAPGVLMMRLPLTGSPLRWVNAYLIEADRGFAMIDFGWKADDVFAAIEEQLATIGAEVRDLRILITTHFHTDHFGMAGFLAERSGAPVAIHPLDWEIARAQLARAESLHHEFDEWLAANGAPEEMLANEAGRWTSMMRLLSRVEPSIWLGDGDRLPIDGRRIRVIHTPGHSPGHLCFVDEETNVFFSGDHVLDPITPNISLGRRSGGNPLGVFLDSLAKSRIHDSETVLPAHGEPFVGLARRVDEIIVHHHERENEILMALDGRSMTAYAVAERLPWTRRRRTLLELAPGQQRMAMTETLAHLEQLRAIEQVVRDESRAAYEYSRA